MWKTLHFKALSQIWFPKVNGPALLKERWRKGFCFFFNPKSCWAQKSTIQTFILLSKSATHGVPPWKIVWMLFFKKGLIRHLIIWKTLHFKALSQIWFPKVNGQALLKERWRKGFCFFSTPKVVGHNRVPSKHSYYWVTQPLMGYHLEKLFGCCFLNKGLIRHLIIWKALYFKALIQIWFPKVNGPALLKERWRKGFCFFPTPKVVGHNRVPSKHSYYWVTEPLMGYHLEKLFGCCFLIRV